MDSVLIAITSFAVGFIVRTMFTSHEIRTLELRARHLEKRLVRAIHLLDEVNLTSFTVTKEDSCSSQH